MAVKSETTDMVATIKSETTGLMATITNEEADSLVSDGQLLFALAELSRIPLHSQWISSCFPTLIATLRSRVESLPFADHFRLPSDVHHDLLTKSKFDDMVVIESCKQVFGTGCIVLKQVGTHVRGDGKPSEVGGRADLVVYQPSSREVLVIEMKYISPTQISCNRDELVQMIDGVVPSPTGYCRPEWEHMAVRRTKNSSLSSLRHMDVCPLSELFIVQNHMPTGMFIFTADHLVQEARDEVTNYANSISANGFKLSQRHAAECPALDGLADGRSLTVYAAYICVLGYRLEYAFI